MVCKLFCFEPGHHSHTAIHICTHSYTQWHTQHTHTHTHAHTNTHTHACTHIQTQTQTRTHILHAHAHTYSMHTHTNTHVWTHIHTYTHTHTHTYTHIYQGRRKLPKGGAAALLDYCKDSNSGKKIFRLHFRFSGLSWHFHILKTIGSVAFNLFAAFDL